MKRFISSSTNFASNPQKPLTPNPVVADSNCCWFIHDPKVPQGFVRLLTLQGSGRYRVLYQNMINRISLSSKANAQEYLNSLIGNTSIKLNNFDFSSNPKISRFSKKLMKKDRPATLHLNRATGQIHVSASAKPTRCVDPLETNPLSLHYTSNDSNKTQAEKKMNMKALQSLDSELSKMIEKDQISGRLRTPATCSVCKGIFENANAMSNHYYAFHQRF